MKIQIENKTIGEDSPCFIIAEIGINHNNDINIAKKMIDAAVEAGCDAAKFQTFKGKLMYPKTAGTYETDGNILNIYDTMQKIELPEEWINELMEHCKKKDIIFLSSVSDVWSVDIMEKYGMNAYKLTSYDTTNIPLLEHTAKKDKPVIMSVGAAYMNEVDEAVRTVRKYNNKLVVLHCVTKYPTPLEYCNLNVLDTLKSAYPDVIFGYSDHTEDPVKAPVAAVAKGAKIIEKHITLDKSMKGADQRFAVNPEQLKQMVKAIRETEKKIKEGEKINVDEIVLGSSEKKPTEIEMYVRDFAYRSIFALKDIKKGEKITKDNIEILRNGENKPGLLPKYYNMLIEGGYKVVKDIKEHTPLVWDDLMQKEDKMPNIMGIIQARMSSTRLPGKTMTDIDGKPFLFYVIKSINLSKRLNKIVIATSTNSNDDIIEKFAVEKNIPIFRGSEEDVLDRMYKAAKEYNADFIVRLCGDNMFLNFEVMDEMIDIAVKDNYDYVNDFYSKYVNEVQDTPTISGIVSEVLSIKALEIMWKNAKKQEQREHITKYIVENPKEFRIKNFDIPKWLQRNDIRLTLDTKEDLELLKILYFKFYKDKDKFDLKEIINYLDKNPEIRNINLKK